MRETSSRPDPHGWVTILFVPGDRRDMLAKAQQRGADAIWIDLEDAIPAASKAKARDTVHETLARGILRGRSAIGVRINATSEGVHDDLEALRGLEVDAIVLPKAVEPLAVQDVRSEIDRFFGDSSTLLIPLVESALGVASIGTLAAVPGVAALAFGGEDFCADLGVRRSAESTELLVPRALVALHARAHGLAAFDTVYTAVDDDEGLMREAAAGRQLGFSGKLLIHPRQIAPVRAVYTPSEGDIDWARRVLAVSQGPGEESPGVAIIDGLMVDPPIVAQAQRILARSVGHPGAVG